MALFKIENFLEYISEKPFRLEKEIQELTEGNLRTILGLDFVRSEFGLNNFRIDTLAFDKEANSFVIIEYKRDKNFSVIDQGYAYLSLMLNNNADFILEFNENLDKTLKRNDVDWSQSRVLFVSPSFTNYQREAINFKDLPIAELSKYFVLDFDKLKNEEIIYTYAFPKTTKEELECGSTEFTFTGKYSRGKIIDFHENGTSKVKNKCYQTTMRIDSGASGGPVMKKGYIVGVNSNSFDLSDDEEPISFITPIKYILDLKVKENGRIISVPELIKSKHIKTK